MLCATPGNQRIQLLVLWCFFSTPIFLQIGPRIKLGIISLKKKKRLKPQGGPLPIINGVLTPQLPIHKAMYKGYKSMHNWLGPPRTKS